MKKAEKTMMKGTDGKLYWYSAEEMELLNILVSMKRNIRGVNRALPASDILLRIRTEYRKQFTKTAIKRTMKKMFFCNMPYIYNHVGFFYPRNRFEMDMHLVTLSKCKDAYTRRIRAGKEATLTLAA